MLGFSLAGTSSSGKMALTGQADSQAPQSMHSSGLMKSCLAGAKSASSFLGWMQSTGQTSTQETSLVPMHLEVMMRVMGGLLLGAESRASSFNDWHFRMAVGARVARLQVGQESLLPQPAQMPWP